MPLTDMGIIRTQGSYLGDDLLQHQSFQLIFKVDLLAVKRTFRSLL